MARCRLSFLRPRSVAVVFTVAILLTGCGSDDESGESALGPGSGPSAAPPAPVNLPPTSPFPPLIPGSPRLPLPDNPPVLIRALAKTASGDLAIWRGCDTVPESQLLASLAHTGSDVSENFADGVHTAAREIALRGQVDAVDSAAATLQILGQPIHTTPQTHYVGAADFAVMPGMNVRVRGTLDETGVLRAHELHFLASTGIDWCIVGTLAEVDGTAQRFRIGKVWVTLPANLADAMTWTVGTMVIAEGTRVADTNAVSAENAALLRTANVLIEGPITEIDPATATVAVMNSPLQIDTRTVLAMAGMHEVAVTLAGLRVGDWVSVNAAMSHGALYAATIVVVPLPTGRDVARLHVPATEISTSQRDTYDVLGIPVLTGADTRFALDGETLSVDTFFARADPNGALSIEGTFTSTTLLARSLTTPPRASP